MKKTSFSALLCLLVMMTSCAQKPSPTHLNDTSITKDMKKTNAYWKDKLSPQAFKVLREKGTEYPHTGEYNLHFENGIYRCAACKEPLFESTSKFRSDCGWPSFDAAIEGKIRYEKDASHGMVRTEIICTTCDGHLGHVFNDGPTASGLRYCVNSVSLDFSSDDKKED